MTEDPVREAILHYCLDERDAGVSMEELLSRFPDQAEEIRPILELTEALSTLPGEPAATAKAKSRKDFLDQAQAQRTEQNQRQSEGERASLVGVKGWWQRLSLGFVLFLLVFMGSMGLSIAANNSLPGNLLYPLKQGMERIQLALASPEEKYVLEHLFWDRHTAEIIILMETGQTANVQGKGTLQAIDEDDGVWQVYGIKMHITPETEIIGEPQVGRTVQVRGLVTDGKYYARTITIIEDEP